MTNATAGAAAPPQCRSLTFSATTGAPRARMPSADGRVEYRCADKSPDSQDERVAPSE